MQVDAVHFSLIESFKVGLIFFIYRFFFSTRQRGMMYQGAPGRVFKILKGWIIELKWHEWCSKHVNLWGKYVTLNMDKL